MRGVLITGSTTPVGRRLCERLLRRDDISRVVAVGREAPNEVPALSHDRYVYIQSDLSRTRQVRRLLFGPARDHAVEAVIHTAFHRSKRHHGRRYTALNVESTRAMLHLAERHPTVRRFIYRSSADVYRIAADQATLVDEEHPLRLQGFMPPYLRDRVEADVTVCTRMGLSPLHINVLRFAEILAPASGSQLHDYLSAPVCFRPLGYDPMINVITLEDAARALELSLDAKAEGVINIPGKDVLPLSLAIRRAKRPAASVPGPLLAPLYGMRAFVEGTDFRYDLNELRFHFSGVLDGTRAGEVLGYQPSDRVVWSR